MKKCPFCAEEIQEEAIKCKHCGEFIIDGPMQGAKTNWKYKTSVVVISLLLIGPLALPLVWFNPNYSTAVKAVLTILVIGLTLGLGIMMIGLYAHLLEQVEKYGL